MNLCLRSLQAFHNRRREIGAEWIGHTDMRNETTLKETWRPATRVIKDLIRDYDIARGVVFSERSTGTDRDQLLDTGVFESINVCSIIHFGRRNGVGWAVPSQKSHGDTIDLTHR